MLGNILLVAALLFALYSLSMYYKANKGFNTIGKARIGYHLTTIAVIITSVLLLFLILNHQYEYKYIFEYSSSDLSTGLLISSFFGGQEGSFLLWLLFTVLIGMLIIIQTSRENNFEAQVMMPFLFVIIFLLVMLNPLLKSPFSYLWTDPTFVETKFINQNILGYSFIQNFIFQDKEAGKSFVKISEELINAIKQNGFSTDNLIIQGKGLNPLLQNFWMQIHPPFLFLGFALASTQFSFAIAALIRNEYKLWIKFNLAWTIVTALFLCLGIMIGGYWAYGVLGWGGYWAWDPVENSSLIPWIFSVALIHTLIVQKQSQSEHKLGSLARTNLILSVFTFVLVIYSTFLTRSGVLSEASVHSFSDPGSFVYSVLVIFLIGFVLSVFVGIYSRRKTLNSNKPLSQNILSRELGLFYGSMLLIGSAVAILFGTSAPIFGSSVDLTYYNQINILIAVFMVPLIGFTLYSYWQNTSTNVFIKRITVSTTISIVVTFSLLYLTGIWDFLYGMLLLASTFTIITNIEFILKFNKNFMFMGGHIAHIGFGIFLIGALFSGVLSKSETLDLPKNNSQSVFNKKLTYLGNEPVEDGKKYAFNVRIEDGNNTYFSKPIMYISEYNNSLTREPDILIGAARDLYISPLSFQDGQDGGSKEIDLKKEEPYKIGNSEILFEKFDLPKDAMEKMKNKEPFDIAAIIKTTSNGVEKNLNIVVNDSLKNSFKIDEEGLTLKVNHFDVSGTLELIVNDLNNTQEAKPEILSIEYREKPLINLVWAGVLLMSFGFIVMIIRRFREIKVL
ncbi:MAG TPA: cytochrome c biogenesis protein CcsA [Ignavibacteriaceae bacterium]|nr:cytochrome c biogenesis protein CcsA [Ignavibacteriaceae bacterium]